MSSWFGNLRSTAAAVIGGGVGDGSGDGTTEEEGPPTAAAASATVSAASATVSAVSAAANATVSAASAVASAAVSAASATISAASAAASAAVSAASQVATEPNVDKQKMDGHNLSAGENNSKKIKDESETAESRISADPHEDTQVDTARAARFGRVKGALMKSTLSFRIVAAFSMAHLVLVGITIWAIADSSQYLGMETESTVKLDNTSTTPTAATAATTDSLQNMTSFFQTFLILMCATMGPLYILSIAAMFIRHGDPEQSDCCADDSTFYCLYKYIRVILGLVFFGSLIYGTYAVTYKMYINCDEFPCLNYPYEVIAFVWVVDGWIIVCLPIILCCYCCWCCCGAPCSRLLLNSG